MYAAGWSAADVQKVKIWNSGYPKEPEKGYCTISPARNAVQNDDHDQQTSGSTSRDMGSEGCVLVEGCTVDNHRSKFPVIHGSLDMLLFDENSLFSFL